MSQDLATIFGKLFPLLFMMMGPIGVMPVFAGLTAKADEASRSALAREAVLYAGSAVLIAVVLGAGVLVGWGATPSSLIIASGLLLAIAALRSIFAGHAAAPASGGDHSVDPSIAISPLAFPTMASPHAIGVLIIFVAYFPTLAGKATIILIALCVLGLNYIAMLNAARFMKHVGMTPLRVLGAVFGVLQVALAIEMIVSGLVGTKLFAG